MQNAIQISDELLAELQSKAALEGKSVNELAEVAFRQYLEKDQWQRLVESKRAAARIRGLKEADVPRLVDEVRRERRL